MLIARAEGAAEGVVEALVGVVVRVLARRHQLPDEDEALLRARSIDDVELASASPSITGAMFVAGTSPGFQLLSTRSSFGTSSAIVMSPTTTIVAWFGLNQVRWKVARSALVIAFTDASVPEPVSGSPYG